MFQKGTDYYARESLEQLNIRVRRLEDRVKKVEGELQMIHERDAKIMESINALDCLVKANHQELYDLIDYGKRK